MWTLFIIKIIYIYIYICNSCAYERVLSILASNTLVEQIIIILEYSSKLIHTHNRNSARRPCLSRKHAAKLQPQSKVSFAMTLSIFS